MGATLQEVTGDWSSYDTASLMSPPHKASLCYLVRQVLERGSYGAHLAGPGDVLRTVYSLLLDRDIDCQQRIALLSAIKVLGH